MSRNGAEMMEEFLKENLIRSMNLRGRLLSVNFHTKFSTLWKGCQIQ